MSQNNNQNNGSGAGKFIAIMLIIIVAILICMTTYSTGSSFLDSGNSGSRSGKDKTRIEIPLFEIRGEIDVQFK